MTHEVQLLHNFAFNSNLVETCLFIHLLQNVFLKVLFCTCSVSDAIFCLVFRVEHNNRILSWNSVLTGQTTIKWHLLSNLAAVTGYIILYKSCSVNMSPEWPSVFTIFSSFADRVQTIESINSRHPGDICHVSITI